MTEEQIKRTADDEIDLRELFRAIWQGKLFIVLVTTFVITAAVFYALSLPDIYKSEVTLSPVADDSSMQMPGQLGGLAALAGVNIGSGTSNKTTLAIEILKSRDFIGRFVDKHDLYPSLMAAKEWDSATNKISFNAEIYNSETGEWNRSVNYPLKAKPSRLEAYQVFSGVLTVTQDKLSGLLKLSIEHVSPFEAKRILDLLVRDINEEMRSRDLKEANHSISYLNKQIADTNLAEARAMLYSLVEEQTKVLMLANVRSEYVFETLDPAVVAEAKSGPKRAFIVLLAALLASLFTTLLVLLRHFIRK